MRLSSTSARRPSQPCSHFASDLRTHRPNPPLNIDTEHTTQTLMNFAQQGILVQAHAGYGKDGQDNHCQDINNSLAAFLIGAEKYSYYGCSRGWYIGPDWINWHSEYDKPLGEPMGKAVKNGDVWERSFKSGTVVKFNVTSNEGVIEWGGWRAYFVRWLACILWSVLLVFCGGYIVRSTHNIL